MPGTFLLLVVPVHVLVSRNSDEEEAKMIDFPKGRKRGTIRQEGRHMVLDITDQNFEEEVLKSNVPVVVDFWAPRCPSCRMIAPLTEKLSREYEVSLKFCKLNVDENPQTAREYKIMSLPLLMFFKEGRKFYESGGSISERIVRFKIQALL